MMTKEMHWASVWGQAVSIAENRPERYAKDITLRYPIYTAFAGEAVRLTFDNYCGTESITIDKATVLIGNEFYQVTFDGETSKEIPRGERVVTDEITCRVKAKSTFYVSFYLKDFTQMRSVVFSTGPLTKGRYAAGDWTEEKEFSMGHSRATHLFYFLSNVSVYTEKENRTVVCYGDSITAQDWPDYLTLRCEREKFDRTAVVRRATSGSRILREYNCITYESYGLKGKKRFAHEVPTDGADTVIIQQGINDIIHPVGAGVNPFRPMSDLPTVDELIEGLKEYISLARSYGYKVYVGTLLPIGGWRTYEPFRDRMRKAYNHWIRTTDLIDGYIDFDKALRNPENPKAMLPEYDSGDHLHPSKRGYEKMAYTVMEELLK
ncbi:MAG: GDSL-type esterase/lipase family protein [Schaedlerella sp.]|nr:GDSL-type esterase/lipase family protein [Schaedlerella sp.]